MRPSQMTREDNGDCLESRVCNGLGILLLQFSQSTYQCLRNLHQTRIELAKPLQTMRRKQHIRHHSKDVHPGVGLAHKMQI